MEIVYYVRPGDKNEELRYSLRSLRNLPHERVWVVGHKPPWVTGVEYVPGNTGTGDQANAVANLLLACEHVEADRMIVFNDDFYVMDPVLAVPTYHAGPLAERVKTAGGAYKTHLRVAQERLTEMGYEQPLAWTLHIPVAVWRAKLARILGMLTGPTLPEWRTMYGNLAGALGEQAEDVKVRRRSHPIPAGPFLSSSDTTFGVVRPLLKSLFPTPSPYEVAA
jgi:hypothetical protein